MKQVIQNYKTGEMRLADVPVPACKAGGVLVRNVHSLISIGTEKSMIDLGRKSLLGKASARPDLVKRCLDKARKEGLLSVYQEAMNRLDEPVALGYSSAGVVTAVGRGVTGFRIGDRVACAGAGFASHAEMIWVPENLCVRLPAPVGFEEASFVMLGGIALEGIRAAELTFGSTVAVIGLGLLGLLTVNMLAAYGCTVIGIDIDETKTALAKGFGAAMGLVPGRGDVRAAIENVTGGHGVDAAIITASSKGREPVELGADLCRKKGTVVLVGVADIRLTRKTFWEKELTFRVSKAAGPGSIEPLYEQKSCEYPIQYVRWTEKRNLEQFIELLARKKLDVARLVTHRFPVTRALEAYAMIMEGTERCIAVVLDYGRGAAVRQDMPLGSTVLLRRGAAPRAGAGGVGFIGGGMFTRNILLPALRKAGGAPLSGVATTTGMSAEHLGRKYGFDYCTSDYRKILEDAATDHVVITTRHHMHGPLVVEALTAGKHVFVEKPLCLSESELRDVVVAYSADRAARLKLMVGFNRRYSGMARRVKEMFKDRVAPLVMTYRVNAGYIPADHWTQDAQTGGGRIVGEVCHFVDLLQFITGSYPVSVFADAVSGSTGKYLKEDNVILTLHFADGSVGSVVYGAAGSKSFSRERIEVFGEDAVAVIEDFKRMILVAGGKRRCVSAFTPDMGYVTELRHFLHGAWTEHRDNFADCVYATLATLKAVESLEKKMPVGIEFNFDPDPAETGDAGAVAAAAPAYIN